MGYIKKETVVRGVCVLRRRAEMSLHELALLLLLLACCASARLVSKCELVRELRQHGVPEDQLPDWVCMAQHESSLRSHRVGGPNRNGSYDYGIFQINSRYWCGRNAPGGDCNVKCDALTDDDISNDVVCAKKVHRRHGFSAWYAWKDHCRGRTLPGVSEC